MNALLTNHVAPFLLPPLCFFVLAGIGFTVWRRRPRLGRNLVIASFALLWIVSTSAFNVPFLDALGCPALADGRGASGARAIVVLGGGIYRAAPDYGGADTVNAQTLERVRYAARLSRQTKLPILASGGRPDGAAAAEAEIMKAVLENEFATPVRWVEAESRNTFENARASARILRDAGIVRVLLVTHSFHMRRAVQAFAPTGIEVIPAPTVPFTRDPLSLSDFLPNPVGMQSSYFVAHELLGRAWYAIRERFD